MNKTLRISFSLKNTYRVNSILYAIKQIPLIKKLLPDTLYQVHGLKIFANVLSVIWEIISAFLGKLLYFLLMIVLMSQLYEMEQTDALFLHILLFLTMIGSFANTYMFNPTKDKYYAIILLGMNAKEFTLIHYFYAIGKVLIGFALFGIIFGLGANLPFWLCILIPFFVAGIKMSVAAYDLIKYEKTGKTTSENALGKFGWIAMLILLALAYGLPAAGLVLPETASVVVMVVFIIAGVFSVRKILTFRFYREVYREILFDAMNMKTNAVDMAREQSYRTISMDIEIESRKKGFDYLNELFIKRHKKILWGSTKKIAVVCAVIIAIILMVFQLFPESKAAVNNMLMTSLPYFLFIMYTINRGVSFTRALFINCDHSLLTYPFYKQPKKILRLFQIRLWEIIKINLLPAVVIGVGMALLLFASGGTDVPLNYAVLIVSIICLSIFFSVHYLTLYYLLQPYNAGTEIKGGMYQVMTSVTYFVCYAMLRVELPTLMFGVGTIVFCVLYCIVASVLVFKFAPKTFRIRG